MSEFKRVIPGWSTKNSRAVMDNRSAHGLDKLVAMHEPAKTKDNQEDCQPTVEPGRYYSVGGIIVRGKDFAEGILPVNAEAVCLNLGQRLRFGLTQFVKRFS